MKALVLTKNPQHEETLLYTLNMYGCAAESDTNEFDLAIVSEDLAIDFLKKYKTHEQRNFYCVVLENKATRNQMAVMREHGANRIDSVPIELSTLLGYIQCAREMKELNEAEKRGKNNS